MAYEFMLPDVGEGLTDATIVRWHVAVGEEVGMDRTVVEVETDKAVVEMPAPRAGVVLHHGAAEGEVLAVGELLVVIGDPGEAWAPQPRRLAPQSDARPAAPIVGTLEEAEEPAGAPQALPMVRRLAAQLGVDLRALRGTGPGGRITREDVETAAASSGGDVERVGLSPTRLAIARNLARSWQEIPHVTTYGRADADPLLAARERIGRDTGAPVPVDALLIRSVIPLLEAFPEFNATLEGDHLLLRRHYDVGFAVDGPEGLLVAVVRHADGKSVPELAAEVVRLAGAARDRSIRPDELRGATFSVSNIGAVGGGYGTPIIPFGTTAILSVGRADRRPVVRDGELAVGREFPLSLSYDHRVVDGARGRHFMGSLVDALESW
jgi:pyruvate dehydrogenase E2 component (dihydrolipoamide acetyltransferase)